MMGYTVWPYGCFCALAALVLLAGLRLCGYRAAGRCALLCTALGLICARVLYCAVHVTDYIENYENALLMLRFWDGGFSMTGLLIGAGLGAALEARLAKTRTADVWDALCAPLCLSAALLRFGEMFTDLGIGKIVEEGAFTRALPFLFDESRIGKNVQLRMNVYVYEGIAALLIFLILMLLCCRLRKCPGSLAALFCMLYGASQIVLDSLRDDGHMMLLFVRVGQVGAALMLLGAFLVCARRARLNAYMTKAECVLRTVLMLAGIGICVAVEFSLDGRLALGQPDMGRNYAVMAAACMGMLLIALRTLKDSMSAERSV